MPGCGCGCTKLVKFGQDGRLNKFVHGHHSKEWRIRQSKFMIGKRYALGHKQSEEQKRNSSERMIGKQYALGHKPTEEQNRKQSELMVGNQFARGSKHTEKWKRENAERMLGNEYGVGYKHTEKAKRKTQEAQKRLWSDPEYKDRTIKSILRGNSVNRPNKLEIKSRDLLGRLYPEEWPYTGDGKVIIGGKNPDFVNEKRKLIIEVWGDHWHKGQNPEDRIAIFKPFGYRTLVIWEHEFEDIPKVIGKIRGFVKNTTRNVA